MRAAVRRPVRVVGTLRSRGDTVGRVHNLQKRNLSYIAPLARKSYLDTHRCFTSAGEAFGMRWNIWYGVGSVTPGKGYGFLKRVA